MCKPTSRYLLIATGAIAVCLAIYLVPLPTVTIIDLNGSNPAARPFRWYYVLSWWPIQAINFIVGVGTLMHVVTSLVGLTGWRQWIAAILFPTIWFTAWHSCSVRVLGQHPGSTDEWGCIQVGLLGSAIGFGIVTTVVALPELIASGRSEAKEESTEPTDARRAAESGLLK